MAQTSNRRALVTGGSGDLGGAICRQLAAEGLHVIVHANGNRARAEEVVAAIHHAGQGRLWLVETPQAFDGALLRRAHEHARATGLQATDDASVVEACTGVVVTIVAGDGWNPKITQPDDLRIVRQMLAV